VHHYVDPKPRLIRKLYSISLDNGLFEVKSLNFDPKIFCYYCVIFLSDLTELDSEMISDHRASVVL